MFSKILSGSVLAASIGWLISIVSIAHAHTVPLESQIDAVTVYPQSARITRVARLESTDGAHKATISGLPVTLDTDSIHLSTSDPQLELGPAQISKHQGESPTLARARDLQEKLHALQQERDKLNLDLKRFNAQIDTIYAMAQSSQSEQPVSTQSWSQTWALINDQVEHYQSQIIDAKTTKTKLDESIKRLQKQLNEIGYVGQEYLEATFDYIAQQPISSTITITYQNNQASWQPLYDINLDSDKEDLHITAHAKVYQNTGEDWRDVQLQLATQAPHEYHHLPNLDPWALEIFNPQSKGLSQSMKGAPSQVEMDLAVSADSSAPRNAPQAKMSHQTQIVQSEYATSYVAPRLTTIQSGNQEQRIKLVKEQFPATVSITATPEHNTDALILATIDNTTQTPILSAQANLYIDGEFFGRQYIDATLPGDTLELPMGKDNKVNITFQPDPDHKSDSGIFNRTNQIERRYLVRIDNQHAETKTITIRGQFPVSGDERINITRYGETPTHEDVDDKKGVVTWEYELGAGQTHALRYGYEVSYPAGLEVPNL